MSRTSKTVKGEEEAIGFEDIPTTKTNMTMKEKVGHHFHDTMVMSLLTAFVHMCACNVGYVQIFPIFRLIFIRYSVDSILKFDLWLYVLKLKIN